MQKWQTLNLFQEFVKDVCQTEFFYTFVSDMPHQKLKRIFAWKSEGKKKNEELVAHAKLNKIIQATLTKHRETSVGENNLH